MGFWGLCCAHSSLYSTQQRLQNLGKPSCLTHSWDLCGTQYLALDGVTGSGWGTQTHVGDEKSEWLNSFCDFTLALGTRSEGPLSFSFLCLELIVSGFYCYLIPLSSVNLPCLLLLPCYWVTCSLGMFNPRFCRFLLWVTEYKKVVQMHRLFFRSSY